MKLFFEIKSIDDCLALQSVLDQLFEWCKKNRLTLNVSKCTVIVPFRKQQALLGLQVRTRDTTFFRNKSMVWRAPLNAEFTMSTLQNQIESNLEQISRSSQLQRLVVLPPERQRADE